MDWVGLTLYHFGDAYPWGPNEVPEATSSSIRSPAATRENGNDTTIPNFYLTWAVRHRKPMAISETAALYNTSQAGLGASELAI